MKLSIMRRLGFGLLWSLEDALARYEAGRVSYGAQVEQHMADRAFWEAEVEQNLLALEGIHIELERVRD